MVQLSDLHVDNETVFYVKVITRAIQLVTLQAYICFFSFSGLSLHVGILTLCNARVLRSPKILPSLLILVKFPFSIIENSML